MENNGFTSNPLFTVQCSEVLSGPTCDYYIEDFLGQGTFGKVARCRIPTTKEIAAVKVIRRDCFYNGENEAKTMEKIRTLDPDKNNLLNLTEHFMHDNHFCLVYELLDISLFDFMDSRNFKPLQLSEIRVIAQQMLVALRALKSIHLVHGDIKPDNVMLVNHKDQPFRVKLIDFGLATETSNLWKKGVMQNLAYRSPEVLLHHPTLDEGVDMWSLGCVLAFLFLGDDLYPYECEYEAMRMIIQLNGQPDNDFLDEALNADSFFDLVQGSPEQMWWLKSPEQYTLETGEEILEHYRTSCNFYSLNNLMIRQPEKNVPIVYQDTKSFISLLSQILEVNPKKRITPTEALRHSFFTFRHFPVDEESPYLIQAKEMLNVCHFEEENCFSNRYEEEKSRTVGSYGNSISDTIRSPPTGKATYDGTSKQEKKTSGPEPAMEDKPDTSEELVVRQDTYDTSSEETLTSGPEPVFKVEPDTSEELVIRQGTHDTSSEETITSRPEPLFKVKADTSEELVVRQDTYDTSSEETITSGPEPAMELKLDTSEELVVRQDTYDTNSEEILTSGPDPVSKVKPDTSDDLPGIFSHEEEITLGSTFVMKEPADTSNSLVSSSRSCQVISSEETSQKTVIEEHSTPPSVTGGTETVKHSKKRLRGIRKFFSKLFKHLYIPLERKISKDNQFD